MNYSALIMEAKEKCEHAYIVRFPQDKLHAFDVLPENHRSNYSKNYHYISMEKLNIGDIAICLCAPMAGNFISIGKVVEVLDIDITRADRIVNAQSPKTGLIIGHASFCDYLDLFENHIRFEKLADKVCEAAQAARSRIHLRKLAGEDSILAQAIEEFESAGGDLADFCLHNGFEF